MRRVRVLHTGGTLGMKGTPLEPSDFARQVEERVPELAALAHIEPHIICNLDSSDVGPEIWSELARRVAADRAEYDGFIVLHGTDTMAYTASALSFALRGLDRPVVFTGAQRPLSALRTDARRNLQDAVELATLDLPEVGICFDGRFYRGCRSVKLDASDYHAFGSPGVPPLAHLGVGVRVASHVRRRREPFHAMPEFDPAVVVAMVAPGMLPEALRGLARHARGVVFAALGCGTVPGIQRALAPVVAELVSSGVDVVVVTQQGGSVDLGAYKNSMALAEAGAIPGGSMRVEAAVPKLMHALAHFSDREERRAYLMEDVAGERES
jgi:L-asparaginase